MPTLTVDVPEHLARLVEEAVARRLEVRKGESGAISPATPAPA